MNCNSVFLRLRSGDFIPAAVTDEEQGGIHAVYIRGSADAPLDSELGAVISLQIPDMLRWMADYRHSEYCKLHCIVPLQNGCCLLGDATKYISPAALCGSTLREPGILARVENRHLILEEVK